MDRSTFVGAYRDRTLVDAVERRLNLDSLIKSISDLAQSYSDVVLRGKNGPHLRRPDAHSVTWRNCKTLLESYREQSLPHDAPAQSPGYEFLACITALVERDTIEKVEIKKYWDCRSRSYFKSLDNTREES